MTFSLRSETNDIKFLYLREAVFLLLSSAFSHSNLSELASVNGFFLSPDVLFSKLIL
jgi:hypothetical protein